MIQPWWGGGGGSSPWAEGGVGDGGDGEEMAVGGTRGVGQVVQQLHGGLVGERRPGGLGERFLSPLQHPQGAQ